jgi:intein/homing endonuclease
MGEKEVFEVTTKYGYSIEVTSEHLMKVIDEGGNYTDKKLEDISMDKDSMCIKLGSNLFPKTNPIFEEFKVEKKTNYKDFRLPKILDNDWAAFLGLFVAEGSVFKVKGRDTYSTVGFGFSKKDCQFIEEIDKLFNRLFGDRFSRVDTGEFIRYTINSVIFAEWLVTMLNIKGINKTNEIKIPSCIKNSSKEVQSVFLSWLFEGDGTIKFNGKGYRIQYSSKSKPLMNDLQVMLLNFGILVSLKYEYRKGYPDKYYCLTIISYDCSSIFMNDIGFITDRKNNRANTTSAYRTSCYFIGAYRDKIEKIVENCDVSPQLKKRFHKKRYGDLIGNIYLEELAKYDEFFEFISTNKVVTLPIVSIKSKGLKRVYDISVDQHPYFIANGFIVHNCYGLSKYGLAANLKIKEKEADNMINTYFERYNGVKTYLDEAARGAVKNGFSQTVSGRKRYYNIPPYGHPDRVTKQRSVERAAKNAGIQGANADTVKEAMILVVERLANSDYDAKLLLTVHDEVVVEVRNDQVDAVRELVANSLIDGFGKYFSKITMEADALLGPCWLKGSCENKIDGEECGCCDMEFVNDAHYGTKLVCAKCGAPQE